MKKCNICGVEKELSKFAVKHTGKQGHASQCKECKRLYDINHREKNKEKLKSDRLENKEQIKIWQDDWTERNPEYFRKYKEKNSEKIKIKNREYYDNNRDKIKKYCESRKEELKLYKIKHRAENKDQYYNNDKAYRERNKEKLRVSKYEYKKERLKTDIEFRIKESLRGRLNSALHYQDGDKAYKTMDLIGCKISTFKLHFERLFDDKMTWENYGRWHIDHIKPCILFDLKIPEEQKKCFNYTNLQPLWALDNIKKGKKYPYNEY